MSLVSERSSARNILKQSIVVSEREMLKYFQMLEVLEGEAIATGRVANGQRGRQP